jgi:large subunit ribosomal protein L10
MPTENKKKIIEGLEKTFSESNSGILTDYRGLKTDDVVNLRHKLREIGVEYHVVKNTLARLAAEKTGKNFIAGSIEGPIAIAFIRDDVTKGAKVITEHIAANKLAMAIKGGFMGDKLLSIQDISVLATLPPREILIGRVLGGIQGPLYALLNQMNAPLRGLITVLQGRIKQLEGAK